MQPPDLVVGVGDEAGIDLRHPGEQPLLVRAERVPRTYPVELGPGLTVRPGDAVRLAVRIDRGELNAVGQDAQPLLLGQDVCADRFVAQVEAASVAVRPLLEDVVRGVSRAGAVVHEPRLVGCDGLGVAHELDRLVGQILRQVVAVLGCAGLLDGVVVVDQVRVPLMRLAAQEAVEPLEPTAQRPAGTPRGQVDLVRRGQVPLADRVGVPPLLAQDLGDQAVLERDAGREAREPRRSLGDARHVVAGRVAAVQQARTGRGAQGGGVEVGEAHPAVGDAAQGRRLDRPAVDIHGAVTHVVPHHVEDVRSTLRGSRLDVRPPVGHRVPDVGRHLALPHRHNASSRPASQGSASRPEPGPRLPPGG